MRELVLRRTCHRRIATPCLWVVGRHDVATTLLLTGCKTFTTDGFLPPDKRDQTPYACPDDLECYVQVDPGKPQWVPEYIRVTKGKKLVLWINNVAQFKDPPITLKSGEPPVLDCSEKNKLIVKCKVSNDADTE